MLWIDRMRELDIKWEDIAYIFDEKLEAIKSAWKRFDEYRDLPPKPVLKKRKTDGYVGLLIKEIRRENPKMAYRDFKAALISRDVPETDIPSYVTIQRFEKMQGIIYRKLPKKTGISNANKRKRVDWCTIMIEKPAAFWDLVIWSDETTVRQAPKGKDIMIHVHQSTKTEDLPVNAQIHSGGFSVMFWGCMSKLGLGPLVALNGSLDSEKYVELLRDALVPELEAAGRPMVFMQDNAPCHTAKRCMDFFAESNIELLSWPAQSPDMNPIENLWAIIKARRQKKYGIPKSKDALIDQIFNIWDNIPPEMVAKLCDSANKRVSEVLRLNGCVSKY